MKILVTGGAGFIGSHTVRNLLAKGHTVVIADNLSNGHRATIPTGVVFVELDLRDQAAIGRLLTAHQPDAVLHFAGVIEAGESVIDPLKYLEINFTGGLNLLKAMQTVGCGQLVFSSTAAVYGNPETTPITEDHPKQPINPYGLSKWQLEQALAVSAAAYNLRYVALRYFNATGAALDGTLGEWHEPETHLIPLILQAALGKRSQIAIYGTDYPTVDGTCIRDYIHVEDLADAHVKALDYLAAGQPSAAFNLGTGTGYSVCQVIEIAKQVTGIDFRVVESARRPGDPPILVASNERAKSTLGWTPERSNLETQIASAWEWLSKHPNGYGQ